MKKLIAIVSFCLACVIAVGFLLINSIDSQSIATNFFHKNNISTIKAIEKVNLKLFPRPHFIVQNIITDNTEIEQAKFTFSLFSLLTFSPQIVDIEIERLALHAGIYHINIEQHDEVIADLISCFKDKTNIKVTRFSLLDPNHKVIMQIQELRLSENIIDAKHTISGLIESFGEFTGDLQSINTDEVQVNLNFTSAGYDVQLLETYKDNLLLSGEIKCQIKSVADLVKFHLPDFTTSLNGVVQNEPVEISAQIIEEDDLLRLKNISFKSKSVNGAGEIAFAKNERTTSIVDLNFSQIDLQSLFTTNNTAYITYNTQKRLNLANSKLNIDVKVEEIILKNSDIINQFKFVTNLENGKLSIEELSGNIKSGGSFEIDGIVAQNEMRSVFDGNVDVRYKDLNEILRLFSCDNATVNKPLPFAVIAEVSATPIDLFVKNITLYTDEFQATGTLSSKLIGAIPYVKLLLTTSKINFSTATYPLFSPAIDFIHGLAAQMKEETYLNKYVPIRNLGYIADFDITFNDLTIYDYFFDSLNIATTVAPSKIIVNSLYVNQDKNFINVSGELKADGLKPEFTLNIKDGTLPISFLTPKALLKAHDILDNEYDLKKISLKFNSYLSKLYYNDLLIEKLQLSGFNDETLLNIASLNASLFSGTLEANGSILLNPYTWNFVYALNNVDMFVLSKQLPLEIINPNGFGSINGMVTTYGDSLEKMLYNLYTKSSFIIKDTMLNNFSIDSLIAKITVPNYDTSLLKADLDDSLHNGQTKINIINGDIELSKGIMEVKNINLSTEYTAATASAILNIYDLQLKLTSIFAFTPNTTSTTSYNTGAAGVNTMSLNNNRKSNNYSTQDNTKFVQKQQKYSSSVSFSINAEGSLIEPRKTVNIEELISAIATQPNNSVNRIYTPNSSRRPR